MDKFIYGECKKNDVKIFSLLARSVKDAQERIIRKYFDMYDELESDEWDDFRAELKDKYNIILSKTLIESEEI